jgi:uncharacterized membrane protein
MSLVSRATGDGGRDTDRLETFSDGVIAIATTLLVLEIPVPHVEGGGTLRDELQDLWPNDLGYLVSFITIGIMWANHHNIFKHIARTDHYLLVTNLVLLLMIGFIPFPTALMAEYLTHDGERTAGLVYSGWFVLTAISFNVLWWYVSYKGRLLHPKADPMAIRAITRNYLLGPPGYLVAFLLAFVSPIASLIVMILLTLLYVLPGAAPA